MKWNNPQRGDRRTRRAFLIFPKTIGSVTKWLETAEWEEEWFRFGRQSGESPDWDPIRWTEDPRVPTIAEMRPPPPPPLRLAK